MDTDNEVESIFRRENEEEEDDEDRSKWKRPSSSYGSMKSDSEEMEEDETGDEEVAEAGPFLVPAEDQDQTETTEQNMTGLQMNRSDSPETLYTMTTVQTKPPGAVVIETRSSLGEPSEDDDDDDEDMEGYLVDSPEPPVFVEPDDEVEDSQPGKLHPEQDIPYIFKSIQNMLTRLTAEELSKFKITFYQWERGLTLQQLMEGDILDFVDRIIEIVGLDRALSQTINSLEVINKTEEAEELQQQCKRALDRYKLMAYMIRRHQVIREGVVQAGRQNLLDTVYVEPQISTCGHGGVHFFHELRSKPPSPLQLPNPSTFVHLNNLFRLQKEDGTPVRTVVTTGMAGVGMTVSVGKFSLDWAEQRANRDLQFIVNLPFSTLWDQRNRTDKAAVSLQEILGYYHHESKDLKYLDKEDCRFLVIMDSFDVYKAPLDWDAPVINGNNAQAHPDVLLVNIIRGTVLRGALIWILGRRPAVSQIPSKFIDAITEIQGYSDEMKDDYLTKRFHDKTLGSKIVAHYKRQPTLHSLARHPFHCWMVAAVFERCFRFQGYGMRPPRLTPFYINIMTVQMNRRLEFYYGKPDNDLKWSSDDKQLLIRMGKMALKMLEKNVSIFSEDDVKEFGLKLQEVVVFSGLCTEVTSDGRRMFCFIDLNLQEAMAALYVFNMFYMEGKNVLSSGLRHKIFTSTSAVGLIQCALERTMNSPLVDNDMFLRFLCGMLNPDCYNKQLGGCLFPNNGPKVAGTDEVRQLLESAIQSAMQNAPQKRLDNLKECLREMTQEEE